jgi:hypothetical protein
VHEREKGKLLEGQGERTCVVLSTLEEAMASQQRLQAMKNEFQPSIGHLDPEEVRRAARGRGGRGEARGEGVQ